LAATQILDVPRRFSGNRVDDLVEAIAKEEQKVKISRV
jgi:hypothetical protein